LAELLRTCGKYPLPNRKRITFQYILIDGVNDSLADAKRLRGLVGSLKSQVNLIQFNPYAESDFRPTPEERIREFQKVLLDGKIPTILRKHRGRDILAACGQLKDIESHTGV
ncbi:hypothetical protein KDL45_05095, partial [bacterium]|nr:hypothetical protein [bacterium]